MKSVTCFLPCRSGSERIINKNIKPFSKFENGLIEIKLRQLCESKRIDKIVLSTNDDDIFSYADGLGSAKIILHRRSPSLSASSTSTDSLVGHVLDLIPNAHILWTHVTSPFVTAEYYDEVIECYFEAVGEGYDSLMTTSLVHGFLWDSCGPINYDRSKEKWPRTQTLEPFHEVNSAAFVAHSDVYRKFSDRIGEKPYLYSLQGFIGFDIDWPEDFMLAESIAEKELAPL